MIEIEKLNLNGEVMSFSDIWEKYDPDELREEYNYTLLDLIIYQIQYIKPDPIIIIEDKRILILYSLNGMKEYFKDWLDEEDLIKEERFDELKQWKNLNSFFNDYKNEIWIDFSDYLNVVDVIGGLDLNKEE